MPSQGLLTMSVASIGMISKLYIEAIEDLDYKILESLDASGCNYIKRFASGILPQLIPSFISTVIYRFDMNLRDATVLGMVGAGGIGSPLMFAMSAYKWNEVGAILCGLIILVLFIEFVSTKILYTFSTWIKHIDLNNKNDLQSISVGRFRFKYNYFTFVKISRINGAKL